MRKLDRRFFWVWITLPVFAALIFPAATALAQPAFTTNRLAMPHATLTANRATLLTHLPPGLGPANRINIYSIDAARHIITNTVDPAAPTAISLPTNQLYVIPVSATAVRATLGTTRTLMPLKIGVSQGTGTNTTLAWKDLFFKPDQIPLTWDSKRGYTTTIAIGVDSDSDTSSADFPVPVILSLSSTYCKVDNLDVSVKHAGPPYEHIGITSTEITTTNGTVTVHCPSVPDITLIIPMVVVETGWLHILSLPLLVAAIIGSLLGAFTRIISHRKRGQPLKWIWLLHGLLVAIIIVAAASIGIAVFAIPASVASTQTGAFVIAALSGYYGTVVLSWLKKALVKS